MRKNILFSLLFCCWFVACDENEFLKEMPKDFMSPENSFVTEKDFDIAVNDLYTFVRWEFYGYDESRPFDYVYGTDLVYDGEPGTIQRHGNMAAAYHPTSDIPKVHWDNLYKMIAGANAIYDRVENRPFTEESKNLIRAKALFFRSFAYRTLAYLYGGVPIIEHEVTSPKTDFVRSTKEQTLQRAIEDAKFAAKYLKDVTVVKDGEVTSAAACHLLAELYLAAGQYKEAVEAADEVINNPALKLMQVRFGSRSKETPGDVYWDLFQMNNQNRKAGNTEGIWVIQYETNLPGGGSSTATAKTDGNYCAERNFAPMVRDVKLRQNGDHAPFRWPVGDYTGGRGIGWGISTRHYSNTVWESDFTNDIRNANHNFVRKFPVHNANFIQTFGIREIDVDNPPANLIVGQGASMTIPGRFLYAYQSKVTTPYNHPAELYSNAATFDLKATAGATYTDQYMFRLAETYLFRAEAYLGLGEKGKAAADINVVRERANASRVTADRIDLDYILDERIRELGIEEKRRLTLMRTGKLYERVMKYNPFYADPKTNGDGVGMLETYNLWPIPHSAIEANTDAILEQNPGYN